MNKKKQNFGKGCLIALRPRRVRKRGQSMIEFAALILFILAAFLVFQKYIARGLAGRWKGVGDTLGQGRIYDPKYTTECEFYPTVGWYDRTCYENSCQSVCGQSSQCYDQACHENNCQNTCDLLLLQCVDCRNGCKSKKCEETLQ